MKVLTGHVSPETAYLVDDYPYGFRLRCRMRYWLEYKPGHGVRLMSQTTNPKRGDVWNKPKASTYGRFGGAMYLDAEGHVAWTALSEYADGAEATKWMETYGAGLPDAAREDAERWTRLKVAYDARRNAGEDPVVAAAHAASEAVR